MPTRRMVPMVFVAFAGVVGIGLACGAKDDRAPVFGGDTRSGSGGTRRADASSDAADSSLDVDADNADASLSDVTMEKADVGPGDKDAIDGFDERRSIEADVTHAEAASADASGRDAAICPGVAVTLMDATMPCGRDCPLACPQGQPCSDARDCVDRNCTGGICSAPTCSDGQKNGDETDVDCGGSTCQPCRPGAMCRDAAHCESRICLKPAGQDTGICQPPTCSDAVRNGAETDIDCGGADCPRCQAGSFCAAPNDCLSQNCGSAEPRRCLCPAGMAMVPRPNARSYCIDENEVTNYRYNYFIQANPQKDQQPTYCRWNDSYVPQGGAWPPTDETRPVTNVDFCDAYAFCKWSGKRLCGRIGGGVNEFAAFADRTKSEWFVACSADGQNIYPYGSSEPQRDYRPLSCNGADQYLTADAEVPTLDAATPTLDADALPSDAARLGDPWAVIFEDHSPIGRCEGGFLGLYDMSGNVWEWEDSCESLASGPSDMDRCRLRGGSFRSAQSELACAADSTNVPELATVTRRYAADDVGFRCCQ